MQRRELFYAGRMNITKDQHVFEPILAPNLVPAAPSECLGIFERAKEYVPKRNVREVVSVMMELMMDSMRFGSLENEAEPRRSFDVPMIEKFADCNQNGVITSGANAGTKQRIHK
jgi:hypothetical protein